MMSHHPTQTDLLVAPKFALRADGVDIASWTFVVA